MKIISSVLRSAVYPSMAAAGIFRRTRAAGLAIVTYHGVLPPGYEPIDAALDGNLIAADTLQRQLCLLKKSYNVISPEEFLAWREGRFALPERAVLLTCDDGLLNCLTEMLPVLQQAGPRCLFFVTGASAQETRTTLWYEDLLLAFLRAPAASFEVTFEGLRFAGELGSRKRRRSMWWRTVKQLSQFTADERKEFLGLVQSNVQAERESILHGSIESRRFELMTLPELRQLASSGMTIGAHTENHPMLSHASQQLVRDEVLGCKTKLESALGKPVWAQAYPFGDPESVNPSVLQITQEAGFKAAFVNFGGGLGADLLPYAMPRVHVTANMGLSEFEAQVSGFHARLQRHTSRNSQNPEVVRAS